MPFRRRTPLGFRDRLLRAVLPPRGFRRSLDYYRLKVMRIGGSPHAVAAGLAIGVVSAWTPFLGLHMLLAIPIAYLLGGSVIAAALGTTFANPITCPIIWPLTWKIGEVMLGNEAAGHDHLDLGALFHRLDLSQLWRPILEPMLIGSLPPGVLSGLFFYVVTYWAVRSFRDRRRQRLTARAGTLKSL
ncbi:hypothetical protein EDE05_10230 [Neorhizobium sp. R1-B]|uniref:DUF2062 domain-containing protein n=1 Tax=unclassified Neorhizobium TaxID=2629175 RepID=UPI001049EB69|nr:MULTISPECIES: DUF2062 domain-containing protein [unclassified Neorhizobium]TCV72840.1 hypothetical protein EDE09_104353 [Neorhizobium sp. S3-V5DH]TDX88058.1 hypothetical protein EDE05_10230 [Neorhizobium sp. R1-B]